MIFRKSIDQIYASRFISRVRRCDPLNKDRAANGTAAEGVKSVADDNRRISNSNRVAKREINIVSTVRTAMLPLPTGESSVFNEVIRIATQSIILIFAFRFSMFVYCYKLIYGGFWHNHVLYL